MTYRKSKCCKDQRALDYIPYHFPTTLMDPGMNIGRWRVRGPTAPGGHDLADQISCVHGTMRFRGSRLFSFHFHSNVDPSLARRVQQELERCGNPMAKHVG